MTSPWQRPELAGLHSIATPHLITERRTDSAVGAFVQPIAGTLGEANPGSKSREDLRGEA